MVGDICKCGVFYLKWTTHEQGLGLYNKHKHKLDKHEIHMGMAWIQQQQWQQQNIMTLLTTDDRQRVLYKRDLNTSVH